MTELTKSNFGEMFPEIEKAIRNSSFVAIDAEFTGLDLELKNVPRLFDSLEERYEKLRKRATSFIPCQVGVSAFTKCPRENCYYVQTYTFYIRPYTCGLVDKRFMCQASCLDFLCRYDFDFNKFIKEGIPYFNDDEEVSIKQQIEKGNIGLIHEKSMEVRPKKERDMLINSRFNIPYPSEQDSINTIADISKKHQQSNCRVVFPKDKLSHECLQLWELRRKYPNLWAYSEGENIVVEVVSKERKKELLDDVQSEKSDLLDFYLGFTKVFRIMKEVKKPIVGHNLLMDLMLFFENFYKHLPGSYRSFKEDLHSLFPTIYDTRCMWLHIKTAYPFKELPKSSSLFDLYEMFKSPPDHLSTLYAPEVKILNGNRYLDNECPHESGYDSYVTGWVFLKICHLLAMKTVQSHAFVQPQSFKQHLKAVSLFENKLNLGLSRERYINLAGDDPTPQVSEFLHVCLRKKTEFDCISLSERFCKYPMAEIKLRQDKKSAVLIIASRGCYRDVMRDFKDDTEYIVTKYSTLKHSEWSKPIAACVIVTSIISFVLFKFCYKK